MHDWKPDVRARLAGLRLSPAREASIVDELSQHLDDRREELISAGVDSDRATQLIRAELDRAELLSPRLATLGQAHWQPPPTPAAAVRAPLNGVWQDLRYTGRTLRRDPLVSVIAVLTLALGIGLNTSMFGFMNALLFRPLPFHDADALVRIFRTTAENRYGGLSAAEYTALKEGEREFGALAAYERSNLTVTVSGRPSELVRVSANLFGVLGIHPTHGRSFRRDDEIAGNDRVVLISASLWQSEFAGSPDAVGRSIQVNEEAYEVVGVLPASATDHRLFGRVGLFAPLTVADKTLADRKAGTLTVIGRRGASVSAAQAETLVASVAARLAAEFPEAGTPAGFRTEPLPDTNTGPTGRALLTMLLGLSALVLLIACSNLTNLLLARTIDRSREFAVRAALGASRWQLIRTVVFECLLLAVLGGAGALLVAAWTSAWLQSVLVDGGGPTVPVDWRVLSFAGLASLATVLFCSVAPALFTRRLGTSDSLKSSGRGSTAARGHVRARTALVIGQFAFAMILLAGAAFFLRGTLQTMSQSFGWSAADVLQAEFSVPADRYPSDGDVLAFQQRLLERLQRVRGVEAVSVSYGLPYMGLRGTAHYLGDAQGAAPALTAKINGVSTSYFDVTGTPLIAGRVFTNGDTASSSKVAIVSESMARRLFPGGTAVGRRVAPSGVDPLPWMEIVGVVADVRSIDVAQEPVPYQLYQPTTQDPRRDWVLGVRTARGTSGAAVGSIGLVVLELDPGLSLRRLMTVTNRMQEVTTSMTVVSQLLAAFAVLGVLLAALGIYGAMARMVAQRTDEIGLRMALGAHRRAVLGLVLGSGARIVLAGVAIGLLGALILLRVLESVLPSLDVDTAVVAVVTTGLLMGIALIACYLPARRATRVDPIIALRSE